MAVQTSNKAEVRPQAQAVAADAEPVVGGAVPLDDLDE